MLKFAYTRYPDNISPIPIVNLHFRSLEFPLLITSTDLGILLSMRSIMEIERSNIIIEPSNISDRAKHADRL
jgi:hypothetical protein